MKKILKILGLVLGAVMIVSLLTVLIDIDEYRSERDTVSSSDSIKESESSSDNTIVPDESTALSYPDGHIPAELDTSVYTLYSDDDYTTCKNVPEDVTSYVNTAKLYSSYSEDGLVRVVLSYDVPDWDNINIKYSSHGTDSPYYAQMLDLYYSVNGEEWHSLPVDGEYTSHNYSLENYGYEHLYICVVERVDANNNGSFYAENTADLMNTSELGMYIFDDAAATVGETEENVSETVLETE